MGSGLSGPTREVSGARRHTRGFGHHSAGDSSRARCPPTSVLHSRFRRCLSGGPAWDPQKRKDLTEVHDPR